MAQAGASKGRRQPLAGELSSPALCGLCLPLSSQIPAWMHQEAEGKLCALLALGLLGRVGT